MTTTIVVMPQLGESVHDGTIASWLVKPGDRVVEFEPIVLVDTDKVSAEVPAPVTGILIQILAKEGETVPAGAQIAIVDVDGSASVPATAAQEPATAAADAPAPPPPTAAPSVARLTAGTSEHLVERDLDQPRYSPAVEMAATELNVDLSKVTGSGTGGRVSKKDVEQFAAASMTSRVPTAPPPVPAATPSSGDHVIQLSRVRRLIAENMTRSKATIPHAWQTQETDMSGVVANRNANKAAFQIKEGFSLTYLPYVLAATAAALREYPEVNSTFNGTELIVHRHINLGVSVGLEDTLVVPVVRNADGLSIARLARAVDQVVARVRAKQLKADELSGGTFTVNNSGTFGTLFSYSVINPGQAGILTMGAVVQRPVVRNGMIGIRPLMYLCFSLDHRVMDGLLAAKFLSRCRAFLEGIEPDTAIW
jgi:2-oxoisovalerate dehydrogenase E2 component (dihydrolipoyl transacylase)